MTRVKICGITSLKDALHAVKSGADEIGFNFYSGSSRYIAPEAANEIVESLPGGVSKVGVFVNTSMSGVLEIARIVGLTAIQLHGEEDLDFVRAIRRQAGIKIIKAVRVGTVFTGIHDPFRDAQAILIDSYSPTERGGTGVTFDWTIAKQIAEGFSTIYLAGGLNPENVAEAIRTVRPYAVDVASGVESQPGKKDPEKVEQFIRNAKNA